MAATYEPLSTPRRNPTERDGVFAAMRDEGRGRLEVPVLDWALAKYDERPSMARAAVLAVMQRAHGAGRS